MNNYFILTGAMGAGKSTILQALSALQILCIPEPARQILAQQRSIDGNGVPEKEPQLFTELLLSRAMFQYQQMQNYKDIVIFDRGIADNIGYAHIFDLEFTHIEKAANKYRYNNLVFFMPAWEAIYQTDDERKMSFAAAKEFGDYIRNVYVELGYNVIDVPFDTPERRAKFIFDLVMKNPKT